MYSLPQIRINNVVTQFVSLNNKHFTKPVTIYKIAEHFDYYFQRLGR